MEKDKNHSDAFGVVLRKYRLQRELTLEQLGERVGVAHSFIHRLETGKKLPKGIRRKVDLEKNLRIHKG